MASSPRSALWALAASLFQAPAFGAPGATSPDFLRIGVAPRAVAMGEAFAGLADDVNAIAYNPAGLAFLERQEVAAMHNEYISGVQQEYAAYAHPTNRLGAFGFSANLLKVKPFRSFDENDSPIGDVSAEDTALSAAYAFSWRGLGVGFNAKHITSRLAGTTARGPAYDMGALARFRKGFSLGFSVQNMGQGLRYDVERDPLPRTSRLGASWAGPCLWPRSEMAVVLEGGFPVDRSAFTSAGLELRPIPAFALRVGYRGSQDDKVQFSWGAGFKFPLKRGGAAGTERTWHPSYEIGGSEGAPTILEVDYAFARLGDLGIVHRFSVLLRFGRARAAPVPSPSWKEGDIPIRYEEQ